MPGLGDAACLFKDPFAQFSERLVLKLEGILIDHQILHRKHSLPSSEVVITSDSEILKPLLSKGDLAGPQAQRPGSRPVPPISIPREAGSSKQTDPLRSESTTSPPGSCGTH